MKKTILIMVLIAMFFIGPFGDVTASIEVSNSYEIEGIGVVERSLDIETTSDIAAGQKFAESMYTVLRGVSQINMTQDIEAVMSCNVTDISVYGSLAGTETRAQQYLRNYNIGSIHGYEFDGASNLEYEYAADNYSSLMHIAGETLSKMEYTIKLKEMDSHKTLFAESFAMDGYVKYDVESFMENVSYPASGREGDWLGCP